jgi:predicted ATPase
MKVTTGNYALDGALQGGFLSGSAIVLRAPPSDELPAFIGKFLAPSDGEENSLLICRSLAATQAIGEFSENLKFLVCGEAIPPSKNIIPGRSIDNLTEVNLQLSETLKGLQPKRVVIEILSDVLLRHKVLQTRKWLSDLLARLRSQEVTTLAVINPNMHAKEEVEGILDLFDGNLEIEEPSAGSSAKELRIKWMHGIGFTQKELPLTGFFAETPSVETAPAKTGSFQEPRWLTPLVDRIDEMARLQSAFEDSLAHKSSIIALQGEAGAGKTRLAHELAAYAKSKGAVVLNGRASREKLPYGPWVELAREYISQLPGEAVRKMLGVNISEFARLIPDIAAKVGTIPPSKPLDEQQDRIRLYEAMTQFLVSIARESPLVLVLDDMEWADQASLKLLEYFGRSLAGLQVLTVCCYRSEDLEPNTPLYDMILSLNKDRLLETISAKSLDREQTVDFIKQIFGDEHVDPEFATLLHQRSGGNPFFVEEVLRSLIEDGIVYRTEKGWEKKPMEDVHIPESVKATLRGRLTKLPPDALNVLTVAAILGSEFEFEVLREISQLDEEILLQRLESAFASGLVEQVPRRGNAFRFNDIRVRELLLDEMMPIRRARYHLKAAEAIEKLYSSSLEHRAEQLAYHFSEGGDTKRGTDYLTLAGDENLALHAYDLAVNDYKRALELIDVEGKAGREKAVLLEKLASSLAQADKFEDSTKSYEEARKIYEGLHDRKSVARIFMGISQLISRTRAEAGANEIFAVLKEALKYVEDEPESSEAASIYAELSNWYGIVDQFDEAMRWGEKALAVGEKTGNYRAVAMSTSMKGAYLTDTGKIDEGLPLWERALEITSQHQLNSDTSLVLLNLTFYTYPRDLTKAKTYALRRLELAKSVNDVIDELSSLMSLSFIEWLAGDWPAALEHASKGTEIENRLGVKRARDHALWGRIFLSTGEVEQAEKSFNKALYYLKEDRKISNIVACHLGLGRLRLEQGRIEEAKKSFETCVDAFRKVEFTTRPLDHVETLMCLTSIYANEGDMDRARDSAQWARRMAEQLKSNAGLAMAFQAEATLQNIQGNAQGAKEPFLKCVSLWEGTGWPYYHAKALTAYSDAIAETNPDESKKQLMHASEIFGKIGAKRDLEKTESKLSP